MKFEAEAGQLSAALNAVKGCVVRGSTLPILAHVLLKSEAGKVSVTGTDLEREMTATFNANVAEGGAAVLNAEILFGIVKRLPKAANVTIEPDGHRFKLTAHRSNYKLDALEADQFPQMSAIEAKETVFALPPAEISTMIRSTIGTVSREETRFYLCGIFLHVIGDKLIAASTDGHRLSYREMDAPEGVEFSGIIIPTATANEIAAMVEKVEGDVSLSISQNRMSITVPGITLTSKLIDGSFPDYARVIPRLNGAALTVRPAHLAEAIERAAVVLTDSDRKAPPVGIVTTPNGINVLAGNGGADDATEEVDAEIHDTGVSTAARAQYFAQLLGVWPDVPVSLQFSNPNDPILITSKEVPAMKQVLMPMRR